MAGGRFAPGHLGELTAVVPFELVDAVLAETRTVQQRLRDLPSRVGVYFLLAMCLFPEVGYRLVWDKLTAGLSGMPVVCPSAKALRDLRRGLAARRCGRCSRCWPGCWPGRRRQGCVSVRTGWCRSTAAVR
ncbi:transposase domain-containing protein [Streptomyces indonesiensis]